MLFSEEFDLRQDLVCEDGVVLLEYYIRIPTVVAACPLGDRRADRGLSAR